MNTLDAVKVTTPYNTEEDCARFTITDGGDVFKITGAMLSDREYTFSGWIRAESECSVVILQVISQDLENGDGGEYANVLTVEANTDWQYVTHTFTARTSDLDFIFGVGTFYIYHAQLELGNKATDWTPNPEDVDEDIEDARVDAESKIQQLADAISMLVRDGNGGSLLKQDSNGIWYFNIDDALRDVNDDIDLLNRTAEELQQRTEYVRSYTDENDQPCLELGEGDSVFKVRITNTEIQFLEGASVPTRINRKTLIIEKAMVRDELQFGDEEQSGVQGVWIWKRRANGNLGLSWKEVNS